MIDIIVTIRMRSIHQNNSPRLQASECKLRRAERGLVSEASTSHVRSSTTASRKDVQSSLKKAFET